MPNNPNVDRRVVLLERPVAEELLHLVRDEPGRADEDLLDSALEALQIAGEQLEPAQQEQVAGGQAVAVEMDRSDLEAIGILICEDEERRPDRLRRLGRALHGKLSAARKKTRRRRR